MKLALSGIAAAVMLTVLPVTQAADATQGTNGRQARQTQRADQGTTQRVRPVTTATQTADASGSRGRGGQHGTTAGGTTSTTTPHNMNERHANHGSGRHAAPRVEHHQGRDGWQNGRHHGWDQGRHHGWDQGRHHGWNNGRHHGWQDNRGHGHGAHDGRLSINEREAFQRNRIAQGIRSGELTRGEARALQFEQRRIENIEQNYRSDGRFTREERADIQRRLDRSAQHIYQETHDADRRY